MTPSQHAKVVEALEEFSNSTQYQGEDDEVGVKACCHEVSYRPHHPSCVAVEALSIMRAAKPSRYGAFYGCAYCQGGAGMGGDGCHIDENGLRVRCPNASILGDVSAHPTEHEVKP